MTTFGARFVGQLREEDFLPVKGMQLGRVGALENLLRKGDDDGARAFAVERLLRDDERLAVRVQDFHITDELQVLAVNGQLLAAGDLLAFLMGIAGDLG